MTARRLVPLTGPLPGDWIEDAACTGRDPEIWFPRRGDNSTAYAKSICGECPVRIKCLNWALATERDAWITGTYGIFGGLDPEERRALHQEAS